MAKKYIDVMDTSFRDGFQSVFGGRVLMDDFFRHSKPRLKRGSTTLSLVGEPVSKPRCFICRRIRLR